MEQFFENPSHIRGILANIGNVLRTGASWVWRNKDTIGAVGSALSKLFV